MTVSFFQTHPYNVAPSPIYMIHQIVDHIFHIQRVIISQGPTLRGASNSECTLPNWVTARDQPYKPLLIFSTLVSWMASDTTLALVRRFFQAQFTPAITSLGLAVNVVNLVVLLNCELTSTSTQSINAYLVTLTLADMAFLVGGLLEYLKVCMYFLYLQCAIMCNMYSFTFDVKLTRTSFG